MPKYEVYINECSVFEADSEWEAKEMAKREWDSSYHSEEIEEEE